MKTAAQALVLGGVLVLLAAPGCEPGPRRLYRYALDVPGAWTRLAADLPLVPGEPLEAYGFETAGGPGTFIVARSPYLPKTTAEELLTERRTLHSGLPGWEIIEAKVVTAGGVPAVLLVLDAPGDGRSLAPSGLGHTQDDPQGGTRTRRYWLTVPRGPQAGTLELFLHVPAGSAQEVEAAWESVVASLHF